MAILFYQALGLEKGITFDMLTYASHKTKSIVLNFLLKKAQLTLSEKCCGLYFAVIEINK